MPDVANESPRAPRAPADGIGGASLFARGLRHLAAALAVLLPGHGQAAGLDEAAIAFCRPFLADTGDIAGCTCSVEGIEVLLGEESYRATLRQLLRAAMLSPAKFDALQIEQATACRTNAQQQGALQPVSLRKGILGGLR